MTCSDLRRSSGEAGANEQAPSSIAPPAFERVTLAIEGLKCGCCENAISKAIGRIPAIRNHQVNIVLARVEFELDADRYSVAEAIKELHGATGYTFEEYISHQGTILEFIVNDATELCRMDMPFGVTLVELVGKKAWKPYRLLSCCTSTVRLEASVGKEASSQVVTEEPMKHSASVAEEEQEAEDAVRVDSNASPTKARTKHTQKKIEETAVDEKILGKSCFQHTVLIHYDAREIGAREIEKFYKQHCPNQDMQLAGVKSQPSLAITAKQMRKSIIALVTSTLFTIPVLVAAYESSEGKALTHVALVFASLVQAIAIKEFVPGALRSLFRSQLFEMDLLIALSTTTAYIFSLVCYAFRMLGRPLESGSFFETSTLLVTLILLGRLISEGARYQAARMVSFRSLQAEKTLLVVNGGTISAPKTMSMDARLLQYGDRFEVPPYASIVTDGRVEQGGSEVDESMITGESNPVAKGQDSHVYAGSINGSGRLIVQLYALPHENTVARIASMVENATLTRPKVQALADRVATLFVPFIAMIGMIVFLVWLLRERLALHQSWNKAVVSAITYAITTLIVSCPCAIALAVPMVILIAGGVAARHGIIFRDPQKLEVARNVTDAVFDKTGTLTCGVLTVVVVEFHRDCSHKVMQILLGLLQDIQHPVAIAVVSWLRHQTLGVNYADLEPIGMESVISHPGKGVEGICIDGTEVRAGNPIWVGIEEVESDHTLLCVTISGLHVVTFRLKDSIRSTAEPVLKRLGECGIDIHMISGDNQGATNSVAFDLDLSQLATHHDLMPEHKRAYVQSLQKQGKTVMFIGDGTNDAAALSQADVGVHINHSASIDSPYSSDRAKEAADIILMNPSKLHDILILIDISKAAYRRIVLNFVWSAVYNLSAILLASGACGVVRIAPQFAGLGELISILPVVLVALQLKARGFGKGYRKEEWEALREMKG